MLIPELDILKPIDPSISSSDDYEIFSLSNAQVFYTRNGKPASLLTAYADTPLRVVGKLEAPDRHQQKYLVKKPFKSVDIEIRDVTRFSYGQTNDGEIMLWALGKAGWFEIMPAKAYKNIFQDMVEAVGVLYFMTDIYNEPRKRGGGPNAPLLYQEYAEDTRFSCNDPGHAEEIFHRHRQFLIMCFINRAQGLSWTNTPIYRHYKTQFPTDFEKAKARIDGRHQQKEEKPSRIIPTAQKSKAPRGPKKSKQKLTDKPQKNQNWWEAAAIFEFMQKAVNHGAMRIGHVTIDKVAKLMVRRYEIDDLEVAANVVKVHATNLRYMMDYPRRKNIQYFLDEPIYHELSSGHNLLAAEVRRSESIELRLRKGHATMKDDNSDDSDSSPSTATPQRRPPRKGKFSGLRPKSSKFSGKGKKPKPNVSSDSGSGGEEEERPGMTVDPPIRLQSLFPAKRKLVFDDSDDENATQPHKRAASLSIESEAQDPYSPPSSDDNDTEVPTEPLPLRWRSGNISAKASSPALLPPIVSTPLPSYAANAPGDSWVCTFDGCSQKVYGASEVVGRKLIEEHLQNHVAKRQNQIELVMSEEQRLRLPVNNLIKRIREIAEHQQPLFPSMGAPASATRLTPIERSV
ncbi:uncharacterized protein BDR25DRAFT_289732 [Lindgomyces ingoldianus]|uniref:Uncharacterized protein n=1 Tax=Lindgomyces ingoldianus TaxID=673940 RepID=A0ACB6QPB1_9PLEO|nr:uncharacterized protein BDR25DRAFT_289732 [Lindgomyces ingoldianus]KAF2468813.1 hypothetical protein BDR25DRAFT_289732 [Lindgomyces ingoldianus]